MREKYSDRGGMEGALDRHLDSDGHNCEGVEKRLGRDYEPMTPRRGKHREIGGKRKRNASSGRRGY